MPDGGFKGMTPDPDSQPRGRKAFLSGAPTMRGIECDQCFALIFEGDWPFCRGEGYEKDHER